MQKKTLREHLEVKNHAEALLFIEELKDRKLSEYDIKSIHSIILSGLDRSMLESTEKQM